MTAAFHCSFVVLHASLPSPMTPRNRLGPKAAPLKGAGRVANTRKGLDLSISKRGRCAPPMQGASNQGRLPPIAASNFCHFGQRWHRIYGAAVHRCAAPFSRCLTSSESSISTFPSIPLVLLPERESSSITNRPCMKSIRSLWGGGGATETEATTPPSLLSIALHGSINTFDERWANQRGAFSLSQCKQAELPSFHYLHRNRRFICSPHFTQRGI